MHSSKIDYRRFNKRIVVYNSGKVRPSGWMAREYKRIRRKWYVIAKTNGYEMEIYEDGTYSIYYYENYLGEILRPSVSK